jgi:hypothetical protein
MIKHVGIHKDTLKYISQLLYMGIYQAIQDEPKIFDQFYDTVQIINCQRKCNSSFIWWIDRCIKLFVHIAQINSGILCCTENIQSKFQFFPCACLHASVICCDNIPDPCLWVFNSCNLGSIKGILNSTQRSLEVWCQGIGKARQVGCLYRIPWHHTARLLSVELS